MTERYHELVKDYEGRARARILWRVFRVELWVKREVELVSITWIVSYEFKEVTFVFALYKFWVGALMI